MILVLVLSNFLSVKHFLKIWVYHFSLPTFESFTPSLPLFLTIERKRWIDLSFSVSARFEQLNNAQKPPIFIFFHFVIIFYSLSSHTLPFGPLFLIVLHNGVKNIHVRKAWFVTWYWNEEWRSKSSKNNFFGKKSIQLVCPIKTFKMVYKNVLKLVSRYFTFGYFTVPKNCSSQQNY